MRILLVEDDKSIVMGLKYSLESEGYQVQTHLYGLGELGAVGDIFVDHCRRLRRCND